MAGKIPGSWEKRGAESYRLRVCIGTNFRGDPNIYRRTVKCKNDKQADKELAKFYAECLAGDVTNASPITVSALADLFLEKYCRVKLEDATISGYETAIKNHIKPILGEFKAIKIKTLQVQEWVNYLHEDLDLAPKTVKNYFSVLDIMMTVAIRWGYIKDNPCNNVELPPLDRKESDSYTKEETIYLLRALENIPDEQLKFKVAIQLALLCGYRKSEIAGLDWDAVDLEAGTAKVMKKRIIITGKGVREGAPKTRKSKRIVSMPDELTSNMKKLRLQQKKQRLIMGSKWVDSGAVITNNFGGPLYPADICEWLTKFLRTNNLRHITLHKLRHTHASMLVHMDFGIKEVSEQLGHSQTSTTLNIYTHLFEDANKKIASKLSSELFGEKDDDKTAAE